MGTFVYQAGFVGGDRRIGLVELFPEPSPDLVKIGQAGVVINRRIQQRQGLGKTVLANFILGQIVEIISSLGAVRRFITAGPTGAAVEEDQGAETDQRNHPKRHPG